MSKLALRATTGLPPILSSRIGQSSANFGLSRVIDGSMPWIETLKPLYALPGGWMRMLSVPRSTCSQMYPLGKDHLEPPTGLWYDSFTLSVNRRT